MTFIVNDFLVFSMEFSDCVLISVRQVSELTLFVLTKLLFVACIAMNILK